MASVRSSSDRWLKLLGNLLLAIFIFWTLIPFYWMIVTSLKKHREIYGTEATLWPNEPTLESYRTLFFDTNYLLFFRNSMTVALTTTFFTVLCAQGCSTLLI
jgi:multiple sugar transport system permease protein